nr:unnamed protein product [Callosobruchus chinensis]
MLNDFLKEPSRKFENFCRMSVEDYEHLIHKIGPHIAKSDTNMRICIPIQEHFAIALRFLASGDSYTSLAYLFKVSIQTVSRCVDVVCRALMQELSQEINVSKQPCN